MAELVAHDLILDGRLVAMLGLVLDLLVDQWVLGEDFSHEELLGEGESLDVRNGDMDELSLCVRAQVVVAKERV